MKRREVLTMVQAARTSIIWAMMFLLVVGGCSTTPSTPGTVVQSVSLYARPSLFLVQTMERGGKELLFLFDPRSPSNRQYLDPGIPVTQPAASPDGRMIAFTSRGQRDGKLRSSIYVMDLGSKALTKLTDSDARYSKPFWSQDGKLLFFASAEDYQTTIYVQEMEVPEQRPRKIATVPLANSMSSNLDGSRICFDSELLKAVGEKHRLMVLETATGASIQLDEGAVSFSCAYSADGSGIYSLNENYADKSRRGLYYYSFDGKGGAKLLDVRWWQIQTLVASPNGNDLAFVGVRGIGRIDLASRTVSELTIPGDGKSEPN